MQEETHGHHDRGERWGPGGEVNRKLAVFTKDLRKVTDKIHPKSNQYCQQDHDPGFTKAGMAHCKTSPDQDHCHQHQRKSKLHLKPNPVAEGGKTRLIEAENEIRQVPDGNRTWRAETVTNLIPGQVRWENQQFGGFGIALWIVGAGQGPGFCVAKFPRAIDKFGALCINPLCRCEWLYQAQNVATHRRAASRLSNGFAG